MQSQVAQVGGSSALLRRRLVDRGHPWEPTLAVVVKLVDALR
jgi:hypothetical protein